ncbi:DUF1553 domain-containing protein [Tuwongella immobilis]|uniref:F5/8 type C domain-containing protein n=1 Tax=Tuwongella immobilis TaxID=692036 RepID=A0A6C2YRF8_9BACT|nr:DUF1553 domain-containing protein [Tuwongella immobilis]VIP04248.1 secreted protein containing duf1549 : Uncharacterized protein OS=Isosphaera pallida (strain ATCC 43644 / DSM 9630 / IS1B) GN=Isop_2036 PE=4 SV=1: PSCyt1: PSCyt2: F5_F8_type_C: PSD1 [Tuwongella immobilis]VTS05859.1 secreted protein containing duf1549 : Uncharacterized protein OS=Isosphaera pallida (strain ATCC 43644 / DSM 9630 / IS1B) GN=Isop_2036 PE=4 SV=1: PSCyt1: PSCyt2: F5_F8_type_C: PSD1 [Tuwongella immobilis]
MNRTPWMFPGMLLGLIAGLGVGANAGAAEPVVDFARDIAPIFQARCLSCHGDAKQRGGLRLDRAADLLRGGDSGAAVEPKSAAKSLLMQRVRSQDADDRMPPSGDRLTPEQIAKLAAWIDSGATIPADLAAAPSEANEHWAYRPLTRPTVPTIGGKIPTGSAAIDAFVAAKLQPLGLGIQPETDRLTLIRRLTFDLHGLPPTPEAIAAFQADISPNAVEKLVDSLLASPRYAERQARHWLDVVRYAESHGFEMNNVRPNAWVYRDWVIQAFARDLPYDQFVIQQLAGDQLNADAATGFLVAGPWDQVKSPDAVLTAQQRADELHDIVSTTGSTFLGLTVGCARCHNHKFDPIPQQDYYAIKAVFAGVQHGERPVPMPGQETQLADAERTPALPPGAPVGKLRRTPVQAGRNVDRLLPVRAKWLRFNVLATNSVEPCIDELEIFSPGNDATNHARTAKVTASGSYLGNPIHRLEHINDGQYGNSHSWISNTPGKGWVAFEFPEPVTIDRVLWSRDRTEPPQFRDRLAMEYRIEISSDGKEWQEVASSRDRAVSSTQPMGYVGRMTSPEETRMLRRGEVTQPLDPVGPGTLTRIGTGSTVATIAAAARDAERRMQFARWVVDPKHPLTARVMVNRIWQTHFGVGIVDTPSDFGRNGGKPTHPELLDWLASEFIADGWSMKAMHRKIVLSATYRQRGNDLVAGRAVDASARLLWKYPPRRLEAEAIRDTILAVTGKLDLRMGGPGFDLFEPNGNYVKVYTPRKSFPEETFRRMVYWSKPRMQLDDTFGAFDCPDAGQIAPKRNQSTTPLQALNLLNSPFAVQQSEAFAARLQAEAPSEEARIRRAFVLAFGREPSPVEQSAAAGLTKEFGLSALCRALLNANEFLFIR